MCPGDVQNKIYTKTSQQGIDCGHNNYRVKENPV